MNLVTSKVGAKHEFLFNKPGSESYYHLMSMVIADDDVTFNLQKHKPKYTDTHTHTHTCTHTPAHTHTHTHTHTQTRDSLLKGKNQYN
jgi:hypothetical protein